MGNPVVPGLPDTNQAEEVISNENHRSSQGHYRICGNDCNQGAGESPLILKARGRVTGPF